VSDYHGILPGPSRTSVVDSERLGRQPGSSTPLLDPATVPQRFSKGPALSAACFTSAVDSERFGRGPGPSVTSPDSLTESERLGIAGVSSPDPVIGSAEALDFSRSRRG